MRVDENQPNMTLPFIRGTTDDLFNGKFGAKVLKVVGSGYSGTVVKCSIPEDNGNGPDRVVAIKIMEKAKIKARYAKSEVRLLGKTKGPNVVHYLGAAECLDSYWIVTEFYERGDLHSVLDHLDNCYVMGREYLLGVVAGLETLHDKLIAHADVKMKNILIANNNTAKLADFGFAKEYNSEEDRETACHGTKDYWAPEMLVENPNFNPFKADIYALGVTFVGVCEKRPIKKKYDKIHDIVNNFRDSHQVSLFRGLLNTDTSRRWNFSQIKSNVWLNECLTPPTSPT